MPCWSPSSMSMSAGVWSPRTRSRRRGSAASRRRRRPCVEYAVEDLVELRRLLDLEEGLLAVWSRMRMLRLPSPPSFFSGFLSSESAIGLSLCAFRSAAVGVCGGRRGRLCSLCRRRRLCSIWPATAVALASGSPAVRVGLAAARSCSARCHRHGCSISACRCGRLAPSARARARVRSAPPRRARPRRRAGAWRSAAVLFRISRSRIKLGI